MVDRSIITPELCRQLFRYEPETGAVFWKGRPDDWALDVDPRFFARKKAGTRALNVVDKRGYRYGGLFCKWVFAHRAIWAIVHGRWPDEIDHINGDKGDNRLCNLREVTTAENLKNKSLYKNAASDVPGVGQWEPSDKWQARIGKFKLGSYYTKNEAIAARRAAEMVLGYHANNGRPK